MTAPTRCRPWPRSAQPSADSKTWTCKLRDGVKFHDGAALDANDVVASYALQWDTKNPLHKGRASRSTTGRACGAATSTRQRRLSSAVQRSAEATIDDRGAPHLRRPRLSIAVIAPVWMNRQP